MSTRTANYLLEKPDVSEYYDITIYNKTLDKIDEVIWESVGDLPDWVYEPTPPLPTPEQIGAATAAQGALADTAVQHSEAGLPNGYPQLDDMGYVRAQNIHPVVSGIQLMTTSSASTDPKKVVGAVPSTFALEGAFLSVIFENRNTVTNAPIYLTISQDDYTWDFEIRSNDFDETTRTSMWNAYIGVPNKREMFQIDAFNKQAYWMNPSIPYKEQWLLNHPVGTIHSTVDSVNPGTTYGGTWVAWGGGRALVGVDPTQPEFDIVEKPYGSKTVALTEAQLASHTHASGGHTHEQVAHLHNTTASGFADAHSHGIPTHSHTPSNAGSGDYEQKFVTIVKAATLNTNYGCNDETWTANAVRLAPTSITGNFYGVNDTSRTDLSNTNDATTTVRTAGTTDTVTPTISTGYENIGSAGGGYAHTNIQPSITCYLWKRTA